VLKIRHIAKPKNVIGHCKTTDRQVNRQTKMKRKANASTKSKEVQSNTQADTQLHHICFCPNAPAERQMTANFNTFDN
jgi:hypothetical protein